MSTSEQSKPAIQAETNAEAQVESTKPELTEEQLEKISGGALNVPTEADSSSAPTNPNRPWFN